MSISTAEFAKKAEELVKPKETNQGDLSSAIKTVLAANSDAITNFKSGKEASLMYLVGQVMKEMKGQANASLVKEELLKSLK